MSSFFGGVYLVLKEHGSCRIKKCTWTDENCSCLYITDWALEEVICVTRSFRACLPWDVSSPREPLAFDATSCQVLTELCPDCCIYMWACHWGLDLKSEYMGQASRWCRSWLDYTQLGPGFGAYVERLECNVYFPLVLWVWGFYFSISCAHARRGCIMPSAVAMTASWPVVNRPPLPIHLTLYWVFTFFSSTWIHQMFA